MALCLHAGANAVTRNELALLPVPAPRGARHVCRPFIDDVDLVTDALKAEGFKILDEAFGVKTINDVPAQFFGVVEVALEGEYLPAGGYALDVGMRGSYDQSLPRGLAVGSRVFVCDNLAFSGEVSLNTKQTTNIDRRIPQLLRDAVARVPAMAQHQAQRFDAYRNYEIKSRVGDAALIELVRRDVLNPSQLGKAIAEWDAPSHAEHAEQGWSVWRLQNAVTEAIKPSNPDRAHVLTAWDRTTKMTKFFDEIVGIEQLH
jgi:hypothetical protein